MAAGKKMMREAQKERKKLIDTGRAFQFKSSKDVFAVRPGENPKKKFKGLIKERNEASKKMFKTGKELRDKKAVGGMAIAPGTAKKIKKLVREMKAKKQDKARVKKMGGGMMGRRFGMKKGSKFPDLTGDGKVTFADILKGRGVINGKKNKNGRIYLSKKK